MRQSDLEARAGADSVARAIGGRVRQGRTGRGWTLDQLAERSGVSRRMLVSIEQGSANPSIATLLLISDALGIGLPALVDMDRSPGLRVTRAGAAPVLWRGKLGGQAVLVAGTEPPDVTELWDWTLGPGESHSSEAHAAGTRELLLVLDGQVELTVGQHAEVLATGDSASFAGDLPHGYVNPSSAQAARFALTVFEPVRRGCGPVITSDATVAEAGRTQRVLAADSVAPEVFELRPDYRVLVMAAEGLDRDRPTRPATSCWREPRPRPGPRSMAGPPEDVPQVAAWRDAYRAFGAKPQRTRPSVEALLRRLDAGLPRIDRLTDAYNAVSIANLVPVGGEDLDPYPGPARLVRAAGDEEFGTTAHGEPGHRAPRARRGDLA